MKLKFPSEETGMRYGVSTFDEIKDMTGLEVLQAMLAGKLPAAPIGATMGFRLIEVESGRALFEGVPGPSSTRSAPSMAAGR